MTLYPRPNLAQLLIADWVKFKLGPTSVPFICKCLTAQYAATLCALTLIGSLIAEIIACGVSSKISATRSIIVSNLKNPPGPLHGNANPRQCDHHCACHRYDVQEGMAARNSAKELPGVHKEDTDDGKHSGQAKAEGYDQ